MGSVIVFRPCRSAALRHRIAGLCLAILSSAAILGCGEEARLNPRNLAQETAPATPSNNLKQVGLAVLNYEGSGEQGTAKTQAPAVPRKIIYDAKVDLVVESLNGLESSILDLVKQNGGFLAESDLATQVSTQRTATWRVRVPVDHLTPSSARSADWAKCAPATSGLRT